MDDDDDFERDTNDDEPIAPKSNDAKWNPSI